MDYARKIRVEKVLQTYLKVIIITKDIANSIKTKLLNIT